MFQPKMIRLFLSSFNFDVLDRDTAAIFKMTTTKTRANIVYCFGFKKKAVILIEI